MTGGEKRRSLWADPLAHEPERPADVVARVIPEEPEEPQPQPPEPEADAESPRPVGLAVALAVAALLATVMVALAANQTTGLSVKVEDVPSRWEDVPMRCHTARLAQGGRAVELFRCRALGGGVLPPGVYRSPDSQWT